LYCDAKSLTFIDFFRSVEESERLVRQLFNDEQYYERFLNGEFLACLHDERKPSSPDEPAGTRSIMLNYIDHTGRKVCLVHFYLRPDGTLGGAGVRRPDPKVMVHAGVKHIAKHEP